MFLGDVFETEDGYAKIIKGAYSIPAEEILYHYLKVFHCDKSGRILSVFPLEIVYYKKHTDITLDEIDKLCEKYGKPKKSDLGQIVGALRKLGWDAATSKLEIENKIYIHCYRKDNKKEEIDCIRTDDMIGNYMDKARGIDGYLRSIYLQRIE